MTQLETSRLILRPWPDGTERPHVCQAITRQEWEVRHGG